MPSAASCQLTAFSFNRIYMISRFIIRSKKLRWPKPASGSPSDGLISIPIGFLGAFIGTMLTREPEAEEGYSELNVRSNTGLGAEL